TTVGESLQSTDRTRMNWKTRNLAKSYLHSSLWIIPIGAIVLEQIVFNLVVRFDTRHGWRVHGFCGAGNIQIARRVRAMIVNLANALPAARHPALHREADLLDRAIEKLYSFPEDLALARIPDSQGLGGSTELQAAQWTAA